MASRVSQWDVLKKHHRFVRDDEQPEDVSWEERLARAYESKLFKEYALVDLKHYKSKRFALRWRTATEVVNGIGDETCGSLRCPNHAAPDGPDASTSFDPRSLRLFELPFVYEEDGERKECLVKVRLCRKCSAKLEWRPHDERDERHRRDRSDRPDRRDRRDRDKDSGHDRHRDERRRSSESRRERRSSPRSSSPRRGKTSSSRHSRRSGSP